MSEYKSIIITGGGGIRQEVSPEELANQSLDATRRAQLKKAAKAQNERIPVGTLTTDQSAAKKLADELPKVIT